jgi:hypothetical protein
MPNIASTVSFKLANVPLASINPFSSNFLNSSIERITATFLPFLVIRTRFLGASEGEM